MAKARVSVNPMYQGGAGGYTFYSRGGEQIMRQRRNNSNYGESASRTEAQQLRRVRWANLVNLYKCMASWQPKAYESKEKGQTDYNLFMKLNVPTASIALTKDMASGGCAVVNRVQVSRGSLPQIGRVGSFPPTVFDTDIVLGANITPTTTLGALSADIIANNPVWLNGDNLAIILYTNVKDSHDYPYADSRYYEITLDTSSTAAISTLPIGSRLVRQQSGTVGGYYLGLTWEVDSGIVGAAFVHTRKTSSGLRVSNSWIQVNGAAFGYEFDYPDWVQECIDSYGVNVDVPLAPGSGSGGSEFVPTIFLRETTYDGTNVKVIVDAQGRVIEFANTSGPGFRTLVQVVESGELAVVVPSEIADYATFGSVAATSATFVDGVFTVNFRGSIYQFDSNASTIEPTPADYGD